MRVQGSAALIVFSMLSSHSLAATTFCNTSEVNVFSCNTKSKTISICASKDLSNTSGYLQYRFGTVRKIELQFPKVRRHPRNKFTEGSEPYSRGAASQLSFRSGPYRYVIYDFLIGDSPQSGGHKQYMGVAIMKRDAKPTGVDLDFRKSDFISVVQCRSNGRWNYLHLSKARLDSPGELVHFPDSIWRTLVEMKSPK